MTAIIRKLVKEEYDLFNVGTANGKKQPAIFYDTTTATPIEEWGLKSYSELVSNHNYKVKQWGIRLGLQTNQRRILSLDFDMCGKKNSEGVRVGCDETKAKFEEYQKIKDRDDGMFKSSTKGNYNVLVDYTHCPIIIDYVKQINSAKFKYYELEVLLGISSASFQVIPPTKTQCKISGVLGEKREFLNEHPIYELTEDTPIYKFIVDLFMTKLNTVKKPIKIKIVKAGGNVENIETEESVKEEVIKYEPKNMNDKYIELLFNIIKNEKDKKDCPVIDWAEWFNIAGVLKTNGYSKDVFIEYSNLLKEQTAEANEIWDKCGKDTMSIGCLINLAKKHNDKGYEKWHKKYAYVNLYEPLFTSGLLGEYFGNRYGDKFIVSDEILYFFNGMYWEKDNKNHTNLTKFVNCEFYKDLNKYCVEELTKNDKNESIKDEDRDIIRDKIRELMKNIATIKAVSIREKIIKDIICYTTRSDVEWNKNPYLYAFNNKIFDLKNNVEVEPNPLDYISITTGYDYVDDDEFDTDEYEELPKEDKDKPKLEDKPKKTKKQGLYDKLINVAFKNPAIGEYYLSILSTGLIGIHMENFFVASGVGGNGKSVINGLMMKTLGSYGYVLPNSVLLSAIKEGGNPQVYGMNYKRFVLCQEPDSKKRICCSTVKEITGSDTLNVRDNFQTSDNCKITLNLTLLMECNEKPLLDETTQAMARRIRVVPFNSVGLDKSTFDKMTPEEVKDNNYFIMNSYYCSQKFKDKYRITFFNILRDFIKKFLDNKNELPDAPEECQVLTSSYMASSDDFYNWFCDKYETDESGLVAIKYLEIYDTFTQSDYYDNLSKKDKRKFTKKFFYDMIDKNHFMKKYKKLAKSYHLKKQMDCDYIVGWVLKKPEVKEEAPQEAQAVGFGNVEYVKGHY